MKSYSLWGVPAVFGMALLMSNSAWAETSDMSGTPAESANPEHSEFILNPIPQAIDALPTVLPKESDTPSVPSQQETKNDTWTDTKHNHFREALQRRAHKIDDWFGDTDPEKPAKASLRILLDTTWNKFDEFEVKPRVRGKIKLPTLEKRFSLVFGDDTLDDEIRGNVAITNPNQIWPLSPAKHLINKPHVVKIILLHYAGVNG